MKNAFLGCISGLALSLSMYAAWIVGAAHMTA
jgi:hypothetical protein